MKFTNRTLLVALLAGLLLPLVGIAQVNSGSDGHDGALNPTTNLVIDMADHPDGIYQYASVNIPTGVTVTFKPNAGNKPVVWLVQQSCSINGNVRLNGSDSAASGGLGGPGGYRGGNGGNSTTAGAGLGPGGGTVGPWGGNASFATSGSATTNHAPAGLIYGNNFLLPLVGGSGGGGSNYNSSGGAGGGGAILIVASQSLTMNGAISSLGGNASANNTYTTPPLAGSGAGSGGAVRLMATSLSGTGSISVSGGYTQFAFNISEYAGNGRVRLDAYDNTFSGLVTGVVTRGFQPIIIPAGGQGTQLTITSLAGIAVQANPSGAQTTPDVIIPALQNNPIPVVVSCTNVPLNTEISVVVHPTTGSDVLGVGYNSSGTATSSTASILLNMPRGGGIIYAKAITGVTGPALAGATAGAQPQSLTQTGLMADGDSIKAIEFTAPAGGKQRATYITKSGKRYPVK